MLLVMDRYPIFQIHFKWLAPEPCHKFGMTQFQTTSCLSVSQYFHFYFILIISFRTHLLNTIAACTIIITKLLRGDMKLSQHFTENQHPPMNRSRSIYVGFIRRVSFRRMWNHSKLKTYMYLFIDWITLGYDYVICKYLFD